MGVGYGKARHTHLLGLSPHYADRWSVKRRVRAAQRRVDGFQLRAFQLRDVHTNALFGVRGDSMLPPNSLHQVILPDALPLGGR